MNLIASEHYTYSMTKPKPVTEKKKVSILLNEINMNIQLHFVEQATDLLKQALGLRVPAKKFQGILLEPKMYS